MIRIRTSSRCSGRHLLRVALAFALCPGVPAAATTPPPEVFRGDARLEARVRFDSRWIYLGELVEMVARQTGVTLEVDDSSVPISGYELTLVWRDRPAWQLLDALRRLYHTEVDPWRWTRTRRAGRRAYSLRATAKPAAIRAARESFLQALLLDDLEAGRRFLTLDPAARARAAASDPRLADLNSSPGAQAVFSFAAGLPRQSLQALVKGEEFSVPSSAWTSEQRDFVLGVYRRGMNLPPGAPVPPETADSVRLFRHDETLYVEVKGHGGLGLVGGPRSEDALRDRAWSLWSTPTERRPLTGDLPAPGTQAGEAELRLGPESLDSIVYRLAQLSGRDLLFDRPPGCHQARVGAHYTMRGPLREVLDRMSRDFFIWKSYEPGVLLTRPIAWERIQREHCVAWPVRAGLIALASAKDGVLPESGWRLMAGLGRDQLEELSEQFPDASLVRAFHPLMMLYSSLKEEERLAAARPDGAGWGDLGSESRDRLRLILPAPDLDRVRVSVRFLETGGKPIVRMYLGPERVPLPVVDRPRRPYRTREQILGAATRG